MALAARGIWFASCRQRIKLMEEISHRQGKNVNSLGYFLAFVNCCVKEKTIYRFFHSSFCNFNDTQSRSIKI